MLDEKEVNQMLDKESIREAADILIVAEEAGIPLNLRGKRPQIICPCHDDQNFGSCYLDQEKKTFKCYACGAKGDIFDLVQAALNLTFNDAVAFVAETCGGTEQFKVSVGDIERNIQLSGKMLPRAEQVFIGLHNEAVYTDTAFYEDLEDIDDDKQRLAHAEYDQDNVIIGYRVEKRALSNPLYTLMQEDEDQYRSLVDTFCQRKIDFYNQIVADLHTPSEDLERRKIISAIKEAVPYSTITKYLSSMIRKVQNISERYGNGEAVKNEESPYNESLCTIVNNIWKQDKDAPF